MSEHLERFVEGLDPTRTILFFGAGSSLPSGAPTVQTLKDRFCARFSQPDDGFTLAELTQIIESKHNNRRELIGELRASLKSVRATGGLLSLAYYDWKSLYTTNYDTLIEEVYGQEKQGLKVYSSNFDFSADGNPLDKKLYKVHGTITNDVSDGHASRIILTSNDYKLATDFREFLYTRLASDLSESHLVIIGYSLSDPDIRDVISRSISLKQASQRSEKVTLFMYKRDEDRALLLQQEGISVVFGGIDEFFFELAKFKDKTKKDEAAFDDFELPSTIRPSTIDVEHAKNFIPSDFSSMFNGAAASYADISKGLTFNREISTKLDDFFSQEQASHFIAILLGASGVGKTTACRKVLTVLQQKGFLCWEHKEDFQLSVDGWIEAIADLRTREIKGILFVDNANSHLLELNKIVEQMSHDDGRYFKIIIASSRVNWRPRVKNPNLYGYGVEHNISRLTDFEIDQLLFLVDNKPEVRRLVERTFSGFSNQERRRRLIARCESDMFVCLKNIFASEKFDDIILREYADLPDECRSIYRIVSALETAGVRVHRQLLIRMLAINVDGMSTLLYNMTDIINETVVDEKFGIYSWRGRHAVITSIIANYKFGSESDWESLFDNVISCISPTYDIEVRSLRDMCSVEGGISRLSTRDTQNRLLRRMMSVAPGERIPRHRLIRNLIEAAEFDPAQTEIRIFENDFGRDGPIARYKINLAVARATRTVGILKEDRIHILQQAYEMSNQALERYQGNVQILSAFCEVGIEYFKLTKDTSFFDEALKRFRMAEEDSADPEISRIIAKYERRMGGYYVDD